jgi:hypothetical protein
MAMRDIAFTVLFIVLLLGAPAPEGKAGEAPGAVTVLALAVGSAPN